MTGRSNEEDDGKGNQEEATWNAISSFEQILEALPGDRTSLETLSKAYGQIGDHVRAKDYLVRLAEVLLSEADYVAAAGLVETLAAYKDYDTSIAALIERIAEHGDRQAQEAGGSAPTTDAHRTASAPLSTFSLAAEMSMAWNLMEAGELTQEQYALVVQDLTGMSGQRGGGTVSTLHAIEAHGDMDLERIMGFLARECGTPIISLDNFELNTDAMRLLPRPFMTERGAIVFELLGPDALVAILNPYDSELRKDVKTLLAKEAHFFIVPASQFDRRIVRMDDSTADEN